MTCSARSSRTVAAMRSLSRYWRLTDMTWVRPSIPSCLLPIQPLRTLPTAAPNRNIVVGKSMSPASRPVTPASQQKSAVVCRYWLASGHCARADCRFAHEVQNSHVCKYWLQGNCFAGTTCLFSHDPTALLSQLSIASSGTDTPQYFPPSFQLQDYDSFPALHPTTSNPYDSSGALIDPMASGSWLARASTIVCIIPNVRPHRTAPR